MIHEAIRQLPTPAVFHLDHGAGIPEVMRALRLGANGIMIDASAFPLEENIGKTREAVRLCAECGVHAKLTGAGCGGCVFGFVHGASSSSLAALVRRAEEAGMRAHVLVLGAPGVGEVPTPPPA